VNTRICAKPVFFDLLAIVLIVLAFSINYLLSEGVPYYFNSDFSGSASYVITRSNELLKGSIFSSWWDVASRPAFNIDPLFFIQLETFLYLVTRSVWLNYKLLQVIQLIISGVSAYLFAYFYTKNRLCGFITAILYMFTPYNLGKIAIHANSLSWACSLLPLGYLSIEKALSKMNFRNLLIAGLMVALTTFLPSFNYVYINGLFYLFFVILRATLWEHRIKNVIRKLIGAISIFVIAFAISAYTVIPTLLEPFPLSKMGQIDFERRYQEGLLGVWSPTMVEALSFQDKELLIHGESTGRFNTTTEPWLLFLSIWTSLMAVAVFLFKHNKATYRSVFTYSIIGLLSIPFTLGSKAPLIQPYVWFHDFLPFFYTIRQTCRFEIQFCLAFTFLASITISEISQQLRKLKFKLQFSKINVFTYITIIILILPSTVGTYYDLAIGPSHLLKTTTLPDDVVAAQQFWSQQPDINDYRVLDLTVPGDYFDQTYNLGTYGLYYGWDLVEKYYGKPYFADALAAHNIKYLLYHPIRTQELLMERGLDPDVFINNVVNNLMDWKVIKIYGSHDLDPSTLIVTSSSDWFFGKVNEKIATMPESVLYNQAMRKISGIRINGEGTEARIVFYLTRVPENQTLLVKVENKDGLEVFKKEVNSSSLKYGWNAIEMKGVSLNTSGDYSVIFSAPYTSENNYFLLGQKKTDQPSRSSWSPDGKDWIPYAYGSDILVKITYDPLPENLEDSLANYDKKTSVLTMSTKFDSQDSEKFYIYKTMNHSTREYRNLIFKAKVSDPNTQMRLVITYHDGTNTVVTYSGWIWRTVTADLQPNKTITEVRLLVEPVDGKINDKKWHSVYLGTLDLYVLENKRALPKIYPSRGYWLENEDFIAFDPDKYYVLNLNFSTEAVLKTVFYNTTNIKYDDGQKRMYFVNPGSVVWKFEVPYPIIEGVVRAKLSRNVLEGSDIRLYISSDNVNWIFLGHPKTLRETEWITGNLIKNLTTFYIRIESPLSLGGSIFGLQIYAELDTPEIPVRVTFYKESSTKYIVHVNASSPFYLIFTETYFPGWILYLDSRKVSPMPFDSNTLSAFYLNMTGSYTVKIVYQNTLVRWLAFSVSGIMFLLIISLMTYRLAIKLAHS